MRQRIPSDTGMQAWGHSTQILFGDLVAHVFSHKERSVPCLATHNLAPSIKTALFEQLTLCLRPRVHEVIHRPWAKYVKEDHLVVRRLAWDNPNNLFLITDIEAGLAANKLCTFLAEQQAARVILAADQPCREWAPVGIGFSYTIFGGGTFSKLASTAEDGAPALAKRAVRTRVSGPLAAAAAATYTERTTPGSGPVQRAGSNPDRSLLPSTKK